MKSIWTLSSPEMLFSKIPDQQPSENETFQTKFKREKMSARGREFLNQSFVAGNTLRVSDFAQKCTTTKENRH